MIININPHWRVMSEAHQWVVQHGRSVRDRDRWDGIAFCRSLDSAIVWLGRNRVWPSSGCKDPAILEHLTVQLDIIVSDTCHAIALAGRSQQPETIAIGDDWRLAEDSLQWVVQIRRGNRGKKGARRWDAISYCTELRQAVHVAGGTRLRHLDGLYGPEALAPICQATDRLKRLSERLPDSVSLAMPA